MRPNDKVVSFFLSVAVALTGLALLLSLAGDRNVTLGLAVLFAILLATLTVFRRFVLISGPGQGPVPRAGSYMMPAEEEEEEEDGPVGKMPQ